MRSLNKLALEVRVIPGVTNSTQYYWHIAIVGKWPIESSSRGYATEGAARTAGTMALQRHEAVEV